MDHQEREARYRLLRKQELFVGVSLDGIECCSERFGERIVDEGVSLLRRGKINRTLYLIVEGSVSVHVDDTDMQPIQQLGPGECFGEMSLIDDELASATVVANEECRLFTVDQETLWEMVHRSHCVARNLLFILTHRVRSANAAVARSLVRMERLEIFALTDTVTGVNNRRWLEESIDDLFMHARAARQPLVGMMLDVDRFKDFNDRWGHAAGDHALRTVADVIRARLRPGDVVARYGGEEFVVLLPATDMISGMRVADRIRLAVAAAPCPDPGGRDLPPVTVSIGVGTLVLGDPKDPLLRRIDAALYQAKESGRNRVVSVGT